MKVSAKLFKKNESINKKQEFFLEFFKKMKVAAKLFKKNESINKKQEFVLQFLIWSN